MQSQNPHLEASPFLASLRLGPLAAGGMKGRPTKANTSLRSAQCVPRARHLARGRSLSRMGSTSSLAEVPLWRYPYCSQPVRCASGADGAVRSIVTCGSLAISSALGS